MKTNHNTKDVYRLLHQAFEKEADSAGIYQGVRKLRKGRPHTKTFLFPSPKNKGLIACEGSLEPEMALAFELNPQVEAYRGQPIELSGPNGRNIIPDFAVKLKNGYAIIDVKEFGRLTSPSVLLRMSHIRLLLQQANIPHYIFTEKELCNTPFHQIRNQLRKGLNIQISGYQRNRLLTCFKDESLTVRQFRKYAVEFGFNPHIIEAFVISNLVTFNSTTPWGELTLLGINNEHKRIDTTDWNSIYDISLPF